MRIHVFQHVVYENSGVINEWTKEKNHHVTVTQFFKDYKLPNLDDLDWLIVMGGPMGVYDEKEFPWLKEEKIFIKQAIDSGKIVLGICLGSQLIASALGKKVYPNMYKEIGWFKINLTDIAKDNSLFSSFPKELTVFHWHGDTFELPDGASHIAQSEACKNQAFVYKDKVIGLQFHLEVTPLLLQGMTDNGFDELVEDRYIHSEEQIINGKKYCKLNNFFIKDLLDNINKNFIAKK